MFFELSTKLYTNSSPTKLKLINFSRESEKGAKILFGSYPTEFENENKNLQRSKKKKSHLKGSFIKRVDKIFM
jgi:hypothetical protein